MGQDSRQEVLLHMRRCYARAGRHCKPQRVSEPVQLFGYPRKAAWRALRPKAPVPRAPFALGLPKEHCPEELLPPLKAIWLTALQPCAVRLEAARATARAGACRRAGRR